LSCWKGDLFYSFVTFQLRIVNLQRHWITSTTFLSRTGFYANLPLRIWIFLSLSLPPLANNNLWLTKQILNSVDKYLGQCFQRYYPKPMKNCLIEFGIFNLNKEVVLQFFFLWTYYFYWYLLW
jgi:hypothetical protein